MPAGDIVRRGAPAPEVRLGPFAKGLEPFVQFLMDKAVETLEVTQAYLAEQKETNRLLTEILSRIPQVPVP